MNIKEVFNQLKKYFERLTEDPKLKIIRAHPVLRDSEEGSNSKFFVRLVNENPELLESIIGGVKRQIILERELNSGFSSQIFNENKLLEMEKVLKAIDKKTNLLTEQGSD
jgi:hypothetical protein